MYVPFVDIHPPQLTIFFSSSFKNTETLLERHSPGVHAPHQIPPQEPTSASLLTSDADIYIPYLRRGNPISHLQQAGGDWTEKGGSASQTISIRTMTSRYATADPPGMPGRHSYTTSVPRAINQSPDSVRSCFLMFYWFFFSPAHQKKKIENALNQVARFREGGTIFVIGNRQEDEGLNRTFCLGDEEHCCKEGDVIKVETVLIK
ncbi:hypothetical protein CDAR_246721 [Caerostris darwini]|uniref:Uncharacterized protein n=1 Tax=Caerostris darwini TaxID=1538125 RepID=A0AAV4TDM1_9ARAC|nr:hypothetical protein CDAR_246721 [Caerostris darwini]